MANSQAFVEAAAQIIPVLVLALLADPVNRKARVGQSGLVLVALMAGIVGEVVALTALTTGTDRNANGLVALTMWVLAAAIMVPHVSAHSNNLVSRVPLSVRIISRAISVPALGGMYLAMSWRVLPLWGALILALGVLGWAVDNYFVARTRWQELRARGSDNADTSASQENPAPVQAQVASCPGHRDELAPLVGGEDNVEVLGTTEQQAPGRFDR